MVRDIIGVVVGYLAMLAALFGGLTAAYLWLGADGAFKPGSYELSTTWIAVWLAVGLVAALIGGLVCAAIAGTRRARHLLAGLVLLLGIITAIPTFTANVPPENPNRAGGVSNMAAMQKARTPAWLAILNPLVGAVGVIPGASFRRSKAGNVSHADI